VDLTVWGVRKDPPVNSLVGCSNAARDEDIRRRAYEIYLERGAEQPGSELDDWLQAERELEGGVISSTQELEIGSPTSVRDSNTHATGLVAF
jgi:hypothetical protein